MIMLSVIIPTYNGERFLAKALQSVVEQGDLEGVECIVVDDGSTDATLSIVEEFSKKIAITAISKRENKGWVSSTNLALQCVQGKFSCFLHQDDVWLPNRLTALRHLIAEYPAVDCFITSAQFVDVDGTALGRWSPPFSALPCVLQSPLLLKTLLIQNVVAIPAPVFRTVLARQVGGLDESLWYTADWDFWLKLAQVGAVGFFPQETVVFRVHSGSQTVTRSGADIEAFREQMSVVLERYMSHLSGSDAYKKAAHFSVEVNVALASSMHKPAKAMRPLMRGLLKINWQALRMYWRHSCIWQRVFARVREALRTGASRKQ